MYCLYFVNLYVVLFISSPFLFVLGDDHVIIYTGADELQVMLLTLETERGASFGFELGIYLCYYYFIGFLENCNIFINFIK